jgi:hypothetical protein
MIVDMQRFLAERMFATHELETFWPWRYYPDPVDLVLAVHANVSKKTAVLALVGKEWQLEFVKWKRKQLAIVANAMWCWTVPDVVRMYTLYGYDRRRVERVPKRSSVRMELWEGKREALVGLFVREGQSHEHQFKASVSIPLRSSTWWRREIPADAWLFKHECPTEERMDAVLDWKDELGAALEDWLHSEPEKLRCAT